MVLDQFNIGGTETHCLSLARELIKKGIYVAVAGKNGRMLETFLALGCPVYEIDFVTDSYRSNEENKDEIIRQVKKIIQNENISVVHGHQVPSGSFAAKAASQVKVPFVYTVHGLYYGNDLLPVLDMASVVITVTPPVQQFVKNYYNSPILIPNGINPTEYANRPSLKSDFRARYGIPEDAPLVLYVGRLTWEKADICLNIVEACQQLREQAFASLRLMIVGAGSEAGKIEALVEQTNAAADEPFIHLLGDSLNMCALYSSSDCVIGTGRVAVEALACKTPVIAVGTHGYFGIVQPENYESAWRLWFGDHKSKHPLSQWMLKEHLNEVLNLAPQTREEWGWVGRKYIESYYHIEAAASSTLNVYDQLLASK
ncbi:glycosyltransferase [Paenibacillus doosanensis]|nr:glycosyltransferase [Paenibacillus konkukensis]MCS7461535.1 glycosyltransferase [Paenibacillus doosanensis]